ncbi:MAG: hypothetical protein K0S20_239 [Patescibacteria group bacterium]|jgi:uncharacterized protein YqeY|nr:hypothetical protein [Patescibacteria group bacterium]
MDLLDTINADLKTAMLGGNKVASMTLRMLKSEIKNAEIATGAPLEEPAITQIIRKEVKKRTEAALAFTNSGHPDRAASEQEEAAILEAYLPTQIDASVVETYIAELIGNGTTQKGDVIRATLAHFDGQTDGRTVSTIVAKLLP